MPQAHGSPLGRPVPVTTPIAEPGEPFPSGLRSPSHTRPVASRLPPAGAASRHPPSAQPRVEPQILPLGDAALTVDFGDAIDPARNRAVLALEQAVAAAEWPGVLETVPSYRALTVFYEPATIGFAALAARLHALLARTTAPDLASATRWTVPVSYDPPFGLDLPELAQALRLSPEQLRARHAGAGYSVYMVGFAPGFTYLGGLDPALAVPRRATPRPQVPAGSVMIGGQQAAIVSVPIPTGWYVLGRTPLRAFDPGRADPFLFHPGDLVRFRPVPPEEFERLAALRDEDLCALARETRPCRAS
jgi:5-oxoprolinase (ATP-hydrolysing) subunit B